MLSSRYHIVSYHQPYYFDSISAIKGHYILNARYGFSSEYHRISHYFRSSTLLFWYTSVNKGYYLLNARYVFYSEYHHLDHQTYYFNSISEISR
jgi:hypothetical protein